MKAVLCRSFGAPSLLRVEEVDRPTLGPADIRVAVAASGINFADTVMIAGRYQVQPRPPFIPGLEAAGTVIEVGPDVRGFAPGDPVVGLISEGGYAAEIVGPEQRFLKIPAAMAFTTAAAFSITYGTAHIGLGRRARLRPGETLLVTGAGGGAGLAAVETGKLLGARVIAAAGSDEKLALARSKGAAETINYRTEDLRDRLLALTGGRGVDVVFDTVGGDVFRAAFRALAFEGRLVTVGFAGGDVPQVPVNHLLVKNIDLIGLYWGAYKTRDLQVLRASMQDVLNWWEAGCIDPHIGAVYPLEGAGEALEDLLARRSSGKLVLSLR